MATPAQSVLPNWSQRLLSEFNAADRRAERLAKSLTREQLNWKPRPESWSVGQCLQHLYVVSESYLPNIAASLEGQSRSQVQEITLGWFASWFIRNFIEPSAKTKRVRAPEKVTPAVQVEPSVLQAFLRSNQQAREVVQKASGYDVNRIRYKNPLLPLLRFSAGTGLEILSKHQDRHLLQAERVMQSPG